MTLSLVEVTNASGEILSMPLVNDDTGYHILDITGLDPVKSEISSTKYAGLAGVKLQSASRGERNITIRLAYEPDYAIETIQSMRDNLYSWFATDSEITLKFTVGKFEVTPIVYQISGVVESMENALFSRDPAVDISIICPQPDFVDTSSVIFSGSSVSDLTEVPLLYKGSVDVGVLFTLYPDRSFSDLAVNVRRPDSTLQTLSFSDPLVSGDTLTINTVPGDRTATLVHASVSYNKLTKIPAASTFVQLKRGTNLIRVAIVGAPVPYTIAYTPRYAGL